MSAPILDDEEKRIVGIMKDIYGTKTQEKTIRQMIRDYFKTEECMGKFKNFQDKIKKNE